MLQEWLTASIQVIPALDVLGSRTVRLYRGDYADVVAEGDEPAVLAQRFAAAGARLVHLVDLDGARTGKIRPGLVRRLTAAAVPAAVQASGGIRSRRDAEQLLDAGAARVVVGTAAFPDPAPWVDALGDRVVVALDARDGRIRIRGWTAEAGLRLDDAVARCAEAGVERVLCTAVARDGTLAGPDVDLVAKVAASGLRVLAAGGIRTPADVDALAEAGAECAIVGRALLS